MADEKKISYATKYISNRYFLNEVSVEGKKSRKLHFKLGNYDLYAAQIMTIGNCITLLSAPFSISDISFWNINHFEDLAKYVFWTFNQSFLLKLVEQLQSQNLPILHRIRELLAENPVAYIEPVPELASDELRFCYKKNKNLKESPKFHLMYSLDEQNRKSFMVAVEKRIGVLSPPPPSPESAAAVDAPDGLSLSDPEDPPGIPFHQVVVPMNGSPETTIEFLKEQVKRAGFKYAIFSNVERPKNKNRYGLNGAMVAMVRFFYDRNYFNKEYEFVEVFESFLKFSHNTGYSTA